MPSASPLYFFVHIPKTGGTSLHVLLDRIYGVEQSYRVDAGTSEDNYNEVKNLVIEHPDDYTMISGHVTHIDFHEFSERPLKYVTILRHPADRIISQYYHILRSPQHRQYDLIKGLALEEALPTLGANLQVRTISGLKARQEVRREHLEQAKHNLEHLFAAVGTVERFEMTLILYKHHLHWDKVHTPLRHNVGTNRPDHVSTEVYNTITEQQDLDYELWQFANDLMDRQIQALGLAYRRDLLALKAKHQLRGVRSLVKSGMGRLRGASGASSDGIS